MTDTWLIKVKPSQVYTDNYLEFFVTTDDSVHVDSLISFGLFIQIKRSKILIDLR